MFSRPRSSTNRGRAVSPNPTWCANACISPDVRALPAETCPNRSGALCGRVGRRKLRLGHFGFARSKNKNWRRSFVPKNCIVDSGPLAALLDPREEHHLWARQTLSLQPLPWLTCEAVLSEAFFLLYPPHARSFAVSITHEAHCLGGQDSHRAQQAGGLQRRVLFPKTPAREGVPACGAGLVR